MEKKDLQRLIDDFEDKEFMNRWGNIIPQFIRHFEENIDMIIREAPELNVFPPEGWVDFEENEKYEFLTEDPYWLRCWSLYLTRTLIDEVYKGVKKKLA